MADFESQQYDEQYEPVILSANIESFSAGTK